MTTPALPRDPPLRTAETGAFTYTDEGSGPAIVAIHGLPGSTRDFRWLGAALPQTVRFIRLDLPGFGGTPLGTEPRPDIDARGAFVANALSVLGLERCVVIGHSMGGAVAISAAVQAPGRVAALGLIASIGLRPHQMLRRMPGPRLMARAVSLPLLGRPTLALFRAAMRSVGFPPSVTDAELEHTLRCVAAVDFATQARNTTKLSLPTLSAWAEDDTFIERAVFEEHAAKLPAGQRLTFPKGGHNLQKSHAVELAEALTALAQG